jgi:hypothetical protein
VQALGIVGLCLAGCDRGPPSLDITVVAPLGVQVGREVSVPLAVLTDEDTVAWDWQSLTNPDLAMRLRRPSLTVYTKGRAVWRWTPQADDAGRQQIEWTAQTKSAQASAELTLSVESGSEAPLFREPVGEGTTLDLRRDPCVDVAVVVESTATSRVELTLEGAPDTARLVQTGDLTGELAFCPSPQEILDDTVYPLTLAAQAGENTVRKTYVIVLRRP